MELTPGFLMRMMRDTLAAPRVAASTILGFGFAPVVGWLSLLLMAVASTLLTHVSFAMMPADAQAFWGTAMGSPLRTAMLQWVVLLLSVHAIHKVGRKLGGKGDLGDAVVLVAWLQFILLCVQIAQLVAQALVPPLADLLGILGLVLFLWLLTNFTAQLHGFKSLGLVFLGIILTIFSASVVLAFVFAMVIGAPVVGE
ncbi:YIP1 family protein [Pseudorhodobacter sp.]|uniref:YIP1 family protein n=1 Tax=Pseudorhodobacter sp. TaxID=1934400 RepID=UPI0039E47A70